MEKITHWAERLANEVIAKKTEPYIITGGMTTSGPAHLGTVCEFLFPDMVRRVLEGKGRKVKFYFVADIMDAFDSIPASLEEKRKMLEPHLGKPLCYVPSPDSRAKSYGDYFLEQAMYLMKVFGVGCEVARVNELYERGAFDKYAKLFFEKLEIVKEIVEKTSGRQLPKDWSPIMPVCEKCGKIATTRVLSYNSNGEYEYSCDKDVEYTKGCGFVGKAKISDHRYKLQWRLHWPSWQDYFKTSIEGGGVDHFTKGGSWDTAKEIHRKVFGKEPPIGYKYGFILFEGKKYSKSKGIGMGMMEIIKLVPPEVVAYTLIKFDLEENIDFVPSKENVLKMIEDYEYASELKDAEEKADVKKKKAYELAGKRTWKAKFRDVLLYYQIYREWDKVERFLGNVEYVKPFIEEWIAKKFVPETYDFAYRPKKATGAVKEFFESLKEGMSDVEIHNRIYEFARGSGIEPSEFFKQIYQTLIGKDRGPKAGRLIEVLGVERVKKDVL
ncbi:MAG: lysine--tRNA ligase [Candidatus Anstonellales archaeon]